MEQTKTVMEQNKEKRAMAPKVKSVDGKPLILKGIVDKITKISSKYGHSWRIEMNKYNYYFNSESENAAERMFEVNKATAFTVKEQPNVKNPQHPYLIIQQVFYCF